MPGVQAREGADATRAIVLYDSDCGFCQWLLAKVLAADRGRLLVPLPLQDPQAARLLSGLSASERMASWHLIAPDGRRYSAGAAVAPLAALLPGWRPVRWLATALPRTTERGYAFVARNRGAFGRLTRRRAPAARRYVEARRRASASSP